MDNNNQISSIQIITAIKGDFENYVISMNNP
jgi:hypothetical protein